MINAQFPPGPMHHFGLPPIPEKKPKVKLSRSVRELRKTSLDTPLEIIKEDPVEEDVFVDEDDSSSDVIKAAGLADGELKSEESSSQSHGELPVH